MPNADSIEHRMGDSRVIELATPIDGISKLIYVHIPKNASSYIKSCLLQTNDWLYSEKFIANDQYLVVLRDPIERWTSAIAQILMAEDNHMSFDELANVITTDDHTETQIYFLQNVDLSKTVFFMVNSNLSKNLQDWLDCMDYDINISNLINQGNQNSKKYVKEKIDNNPDLVLKLKQHFAEDYALINRVKFYGT